MKISHILARSALAGLGSVLVSTPLFAAGDFAAAWNQLKPLTAASVVASGSVEAVCSDFQGPVVAWGDVRLARFAVNDTGVLLRDNSSLVAGGSVTLRDGSVKRGHVVAHGGIMMRNYSVNGALFSNQIDTFDGEDMGSYFLPATDVLRDGVLHAAFSYALTNPLKSLPSTHVVKDANDELIFGSASDHGCGGLQIYDVDSADLAAAMRVRLDNACASKIVIRVVGSTVSFAHKGDVVVAAGIKAEDVLWFVEGAGLVEFFDVVLHGTLIAPAAKVVFHTGRLEGLLVAKEVEGNPNGRPFGYSFYCAPSDAAAQINFHPFDATLLQN